MKMPAFEWVHVQLHQQKGMISLSPPTICNSAVTMVGGGAFGNEPGWIISALRRALYLVSHHNLEVMFVSYRHTPAALYSLIEEF
ncbi:hypothetical protein CJP33_25700 [Klebsiella pneumoniae]|nr:hypothetical protein CJP33_25700 [Klebsiella pneumoniae]